MDSTDFLRFSANEQEPHPRPRPIHESTDPFPVSLASLRPCARRLRAGRRSRRRRLHRRRRPHRRSGHAGRRSRPLPGVSRAHTLGDCGARRRRGGQGRRRDLGGRQGRAQGRRRPLRRAGAAALRPLPRGPGESSRTDGGGRPRFGHDARRPFRRDDLGLRQGRRRPGRRAFPRRAARRAHRRGVRRRGTLRRTRADVPVGVRGQGDETGGIRLRLPSRRGHDRPEGSCQRRRRPLRPNRRQVVSGGAGRSL